MKKRIDPKITVLLALYAEYQKPVPNMTSLSADSLDLDEDVFNYALAKLQNEELISGAVVEYVDQVDKPIVRLLGQTTVTRLGINVAEEFLSLKQNFTAQEKLKEMIKRTGEASWTALKEIAIQALAEYVKSAVR